MDKEEEVQPEQIEDYCRQLGLQLRDEQEISMDEGPSQDTVLGVAVDGQNSNENGQPIPPTHARLEERDKSNFECKNCDKNFTSSRQFLKHRCVPKGEPRSEQEKTKGKKRGRKPKRRKSASTATQGGSNEAGTDGNPKTTETFVDESIDHLSDHTYNIKDDEGLPNQCTGNTTHDKNIQCESCKLLDEIDPEGIDNPDKIPCEKCQELSVNATSALVADDEVPTLVADAIPAVVTDATPSLKSTEESRSNEGNTKKRKYSFKTKKQNCPHCDKGFHSQKRFDKHLSVCKKNLVCSFCQKDFSANGRMAYVQYQAHYYTHLDTKPFTCEVCTRGFIRKADLDRHKIIHTDDYKPQRCAQCGAVFASEENLSRHMHKHEKLTLACEKCGQTFARQVTLDKHVAVCQTETSCEICGKVFKCLSKNVKSRYQEHMFIHTGEKPYKCQFCERGFRDRSTRRKHERTHTGEKPYPCTVCDKAFSQLRLLRNHVRTHTGEKPYACELCPLRFAKSCNLKYHMRVHTKEKPYMCEICFKTFTQSGTYHKHMRRHLEARAQGKEPEKEIAATMIEFQATATTEEGLSTEFELGSQRQDNEDSLMVNYSNQDTAADSSLNPEAIEIVEDPVDEDLAEGNPDSSQIISDEVSTQPPTDSETTIPEMPTISGEEITIIVSEGDHDGVAEALASIDVDQISSILASCS